MSIKTTEHAEAMSLYQYVRLHEGKYPELALFHAIPNGARMSWTRNKDGQRYSSAANTMLAEGLRSGVPDYFLPVPRSAYYGLYIELKANLYMPSLEQVYFLLATRGLGYRSTCCWSAGAAISVLDTYLVGGDLIKNRIFYNVPDSKIEALNELILEAGDTYKIPDRYYKNVTLID